MQSMENDVIVVGAGAAGIYMACRLAEAGKRVLVLEKGEAWKPSDLISSQIWARRLKWHGAPVEKAGDHGFGHNMNSGCGLGGAALHHYAGWPRLREVDFKLRRDSGKGLDWPIDYEDLRPWYDLIQDKFGLSGDAEKEQGRPNGKPYPMPPLPTFAQGRILSRGFKALSLEVSVTPMAVNSRPYKGRPACLYDGWCDAGCPTGALANPLLTQVSDARAAGVRFLTECEVHSISTDKNGRASEVRYLDKNGHKQVAKASGLVNRVFTTQEQALAGARETAGLIAEKSPLAVRGVKRALRHARDCTVADGLDQMASWNAGMFVTEDVEIAIEAQRNRGRAEFKNLLPD